MNPKNRCICPAAQLYTVRDFTKTPEAIETTLRKIKAIGFQAIQISGFGPIEPGRLAALVAELELDVCITHSPWERMRDDLDALIAEHRLLHCDTIGLGYLRASITAPSRAFPPFSRMRVKSQNGLRMQDFALPITTTPLSWNGWRTAG